MTRKLMTSISLLAVAAAVTAGSADPASAGADANACLGKARAQQTAGRAQSARQPVAMVPGLKYDPRTMTPRGICRARAFASPEV